MMDSIRSSNENNKQHGNNRFMGRLVSVTTLVAICALFFVFKLSTRKLFSTSSELQIKSSIQADPTILISPEEKIPHVFFQDLKYRRVCSTVYKSVLCLYIRYPFHVPLQDPTVTFPKPVDDRFYKNSYNLVMVDGRLLELCREAFDKGNTTMPERMQQCLDRSALSYANSIVAAYTRQVAGQAEEEWYGTGSTTQLRRVHNFFDQHAVVVLGDSLSRYVSFCMSQLFEECQLFPSSSFRCGRRGSLLSKQPQEDAPRKPVPKATSNDGPKYDVSECDANAIWLGFVYYMIQGGANLQPAVNETLSLLEMFRSRGIRAGDAWTNASSGSKSQTRPLRPMSILVEFPIAHSQTHAMIQSSLGQVQFNQERFSKMILNITTPAAQAELAELGFKLEHLVIFDGTPQHFPTETGAYADIRYQTSEEQFLQAKGYPGWRPELGSTCRGPLPPNSTLKHINQMSRDSFANLGFDMDRWYGTTWEFSNQFWWEEAMWKHNQLDCTHPHAPIGGAVCAHKYFLQAMIDGYYEEHPKK
jgi:hypothetical protein